MPKFDITDTDGNEYFPHDRIRKLEKSARDICMNPKGRMLKDKPPQNKCFRYPEDEHSFFKKLAPLLYEYEQAMEPSHILQEALEENLSDLEKIKSYLSNSFGFSKSAVEKAWRRRLPF